MKKAVLIASLLALTAVDANAVSQAVKDACRDDYKKYCDKLEVGSEALRVCMRGVALKLSKPCLQALADSGEVTKADIDWYLSQTRKD
jgi:hypothetical protein